MMAFIASSAQIAAEQLRTKTSMLEPEQRDAELCLSLQELHSLKFPDCQVSPWIQTFNLGGGLVSFASSPDLA